MCNDGARRLSNVKELTFKDGTRQYNLATAENPIATEMITADAKIKVQQKYMFRTAEFAVESINNYYENGTEGGGTDNDRQTENSRIYNYYGQELSEMDEYGIKKVYEYNEYGQLINRRIIGSDSSVGQSSSIEYAAEGGAASWAISGYDYHTYGYNSPFGMLTDIVGGGYNAASGAYDQTGDKQTFEYGGYNDRVVKTSLYDSGTLSGSNEIIYENGRIRTVSDGYVKYGQKHDFVNDKVEYTRFNGDDEEVVQTDIIEKTENGQTHTSRFDGNGNTEIATNLDKYARVSKIIEGDTNAEYVYQAGAESAAAQKISSINDGFEGGKILGRKICPGYVFADRIEPGQNRLTFIHGARLIAEKAAFFEAGPNILVPVNGVSYTEFAPDGTAELATFKAPYLPGDYVVYQQDDRLRLAKFCLGEHKRPGAYRVCGTGILLTLKNKTVRCEADEEGFLSVQGKPLTGKTFGL